VLALAIATTPVWAKAKSREEAAHREAAAHTSKEPFGDVPKGPVQIFVSISQQKLHLYSNGVHVADTSVATGVPSLPTPLGVFSVIQKQVFHRSNLYSNAPMPFMQRITWSGVALHEGESIGHRASHGCIRMPGEFARRLYGFTRLGARVIVANGELKPSEFSDPHLFAHKDAPPDQPAPAAAAADSATPVVAGSGTESPHEAAKTETANAAIQLAVATSDAAAAKDDTIQKNPALATADDHIPVPAAKPPELAAAPARKSPITVFISRKEKKVFVRQDFEPLFETAVAIDHPEQPLGTHVFTAMEYAGDDHTQFRWTVVTMPDEAVKGRHAEQERNDRHGRHKVADSDEDGETPAPQTAAEALARLTLPQNAIDYISQLIVPGSSLIVTDQGLGEETGEGTDFIVVTR
jgi:hypothetical protein